MIECAYGRKFPELVLHFDGNIWIESYSIQLKKAQWRNRKTGQIVDEKPENLSNLKNMKMHVTLPTHPFIYSSKYGTWSNATFENGDEDYFEEISIGPCSHRHNSSSSSSFSLFDQDIKRKQQTKESRAMINDNKEVRRNSSGSHKGLKLSVESIANNNKQDSPRGGVTAAAITITTAVLMPNSARLSSSRLSSSSIAISSVTSTPRTPVTAAASSASVVAALAESQAHAESLARDEAKSKHHTQLGSHFVKPGGSALLSRGSGSIRKLSIGTGGGGGAVTLASRSNSFSADNTTASTAAATTASGGGGIATLDSISEDNISVSHKASIFSPTRKDIVAAYSNKKFDDDEEDDGGDSNKNANNNMRRPPPPPPPPRLPSPRDTAAASSGISSSTMNNTPSMKLFLPVSSSAADGDDDDDEDEDGYNTTASAATATKPAVKTITSSPPKAPTTSSNNNNNYFPPQPPAVPPPPPPLSPRQLAAMTANGGSTDNGITAVDTTLHRSTSSSSTLTSSTQSKGNNNNNSNKSSGIIVGSAPTVVRPAASGTGAVLDATQRNKEFFKRVKEQEEEEKRRKEQEVTQLDASTLAAIKEQELSANMHNNEKTKHYAKLGSTFTVKGPTGTAILQSRSKVTATPIPTTAAATSK